MTHDGLPASGSDHYAVRRRTLLLIAALVVPFVLLRASLLIAPNADLDVAGYNIHHLFTGLLLVAAGGIPLALSVGGRRTRDAAVVLFGVGLSLALDEWVYLIATDGSNASYLLPVSFRGGVVMVGLAVSYTLVLFGMNRWRGGGGDATA